MYNWRNYLCFVLVFCSLSREFHDGARIVKVL